MGCYNRPSAIWKVSDGGGDGKGKDKDKGKDKGEGKGKDKGDGEGKDKGSVPERLTPSDQACRSPRVLRHAGKSTLVYLSHEVYGPHHSSAKLYALDLDSDTNSDTSTNTNTNSDTNTNPLPNPLPLPLTSKLKLLIDTVWDPDLTRDAFPGLYLDQLPRLPFLVLDDTPYVLLHSVRTHYGAMYLVSVESGECRRVVESGDGDGHGHGGGDIYSWIVLATDGANTFVCSNSRTNDPHKLFLGTITCTSGSPGSPGAPTLTITLQIIDRPHLSPTGM